MRWWFWHMVYNRNFSLDGRRDCAPDPKIYGMTRKNPYATEKIVRFAREYDTGEAPQGRASLSEQEVKQALQFAIRIVRHCGIVITNEHPFHFYATSIHVRERPSIWEKCSWRSSVVPNSVQVNREDILIITGAYMPTNIGLQNVQGGRLKCDTKLRLPKRRSDICQHEL